MQARWPSDDMVSGKACGQQFEGYGERCCGSLDVNYLLSSEAICAMGRLFSVRIVGRINEGLRRIGRSELLTSADCV